VLDKEEYRSLASENGLTEDARLELERTTAAFRTMLLGQAVSKGDITGRSIKKAYNGFEKAIRAQHASSKPASWSLQISIVLTGAGTAGAGLSPVYKAPAALPEETYVVASAVLIAVGVVVQVYSLRKGGG
jgi:hypothetical protein